MCGFTGMLRFQDDLKDSDNVALSNMRDALAHRGPDAFGLWQEGCIGLGHRRLSILDLSANGAQPMYSMSGRYVIVYNGEIYNFEALRTELEAEGVRFRSVNDTEVMLGAFDRWGIEKSLSRFNGMFAFALWDRQQKRLFLARDQVGIKPLFWAHIPGGIIFGSELKSLIKNPLFDRKINEQALGDYFARTYIAAPRTIYQDCYRALPGHVTHFDQSGDIKYFSWAPQNQLTCDPANLSDEDLTNAFELEMGRAVNRHMRADVPVAAFLSGGNDSALISALLSRSGNFKTYSVGYAEKQYDESAHAKAIADHLSLPHESIILGPDDTSNVIDKLPDFYDEPFADASALPTFMLSKHVASYTKVALSGDGADELFAGYPRYTHAAAEWQKIGFLPPVLRSVLSASMPNQPPLWLQAFTKPVLSNPARSLPYLKKMLSEHSILTHFYYQNYIGLPPDTLKNSSLLNIASDDIAAFKTQGDPLRTLLSYDQAVRLPDGMLTKVDRASMAASLEVRVPFLDRDIIAFSRAMKSRSLASSPAKKLIKDVLKRYIPEKMVNMPKTGFHIPMKLWLRSHFREWAQDLLSGAEDSYIDLPAARRLWSEYADNGRDDLFLRLWCILMYRQWISAAVR